MAAIRTPCVVPDPRLPLILAGSVCILVDDGVAVAADYPIMEKIFLNEAQRHPSGMTLLTIVPADARPPPEDIRNAIRHAIENVSQHMAAVCWFVEARGFKSAAARAVLTGLVMLMKPPYPSHITTELLDALGWSFERSGMKGELDLPAVAVRVGQLRADIDRRHAKRA